MKAHAMAAAERKKDNLRLACVLASVVAVFFIGFIGRMAWLGG